MAGTTLSAGSHGFLAAHSADMLFSESRQNLLLCELYKWRVASAVHMQTGINGFAPHGQVCNLGALSMTNVCH